MNITCSTTMENISNISNGTTDESDFYIASSLIRNICLPLIAVIGLIGNTMSIFVFSSKNMRTSSCSVFLAALAFVDNIFLISLLISWIDGEFYSLLTTKVGCMTIVFITYVASFLSVWFIVGFTCERFFAICFPLRSSFMCTVFREKIVVFAMSGVAIFLYNFSLWTTEVQNWRGRYRCLPKQEYLEFLNVITWADTFLTMIIPFVIILTMNSKVIFTIMKSFPIKPFESAKDNNKENNNIRSVRGRRCPTIRVTRTVLLVSTTFLFLNLPSHIIRLYSLIISFSSTSSIEISWKFQFAQEIAQILYYSTFSCNFILYTMFGRNFKRSLVTLLRCRTSQDDYRRQIKIRLSSTVGQSTATSL